MPGGDSTSRRSAATTITEEILDPARHPKRAWRTIKWREGTAEWLSSRFARVRVRIAHRDYQLTQGRPEEWLLIEWPEGEDEPTKYWLSTLATSPSCAGASSDQPAERDVFCLSS